MPAGGRRGFLVLRHPSTGSLVVSSSIGNENLRNLTGISPLRDSPRASGSKGAAKPRFDYNSQIPQLSSLSILMI